MGLARDFRDLDLYQRAFAGAKRVYDLSRRFPQEERYSLTDQLRRSSRSVCANIAEGWRKRRYPASFVSKLSDADTEAGETTVWLDFAFEHRFLSVEDHAELRDTYDHICRQLTRMMDAPDAWCQSTARIAAKRP